jgi:excisionase family DNA binding protein
MNNDKYVGTEEVAEMLGLHTRTVLRRVKSGRIKQPDLTFARHWLWLKSGLSELIIR